MKQYEENLIRNMCYNLYVEDWKISHNVTRVTEMDYIKDYYQNIMFDSAYDNKTCTYYDYLSEFGYNGELYVCYDEFIDNEYQDVKYIEKLLQFYPYDLFINVYKKDIETLKSKERKDVL